MSFAKLPALKVSLPHPDTDTLKRILTFPPLPLFHDGLQPLLLLLRGLGHADEPLVLGRVVDLPAVVYDVPAAVVVSCKAEAENHSHVFDFTRFIKSSPRKGWNNANPLLFWLIWAQDSFSCLTGRAIN